MFIYCEAALCILSILIKGILYCFYKKVVKDSCNMANAHSKMLNNIKAAFEQEYNNSNGIENINMFVYKYMFEVRVLGLKISAWEAMGIFNVLLCAIIGGVAAFRAFVEGYDEQYIIMHVMCGFIAGFLIVLSDLAANIQNKIEHLHVNICLYLENDMKPALEKKHIFINEHEKEVAEDIDAGIVELFRLMNESSDKKRVAEKKEIKKEMPEAKREKSAIGNSSVIDEEEILKDVIEEYLA